MKKIRFIVSLLMTAAMLPGVLPLGVHAVTMIDEIRILDYQRPLIGQTAGGNLISVALPDGAPYAVASLDRENGTTGKNMETDDCFEAGQEYYLRFDLSPAAGYVFAEHCSVLINGGADRVDGEFTTQDEDGMLTFYTVNYTLTDALRGDVDRDGTANISDVTELLNILAGAKTEDPALCDLNGDGYVNVTEPPDILKGA